MKARLIVIPIDDISRLFRDYLHITGYPLDAKPVMFRPDPATRKLVLEVESAGWEGKQPPEVINFELKQSYMVS